MAIRPRPRRALRQYYVSGTFQIAVKARSAEQAMTVAARRAAVITRSHNINILFDTIAADVGPTVGLADAATLDHSMS
jgi:hypothetical protein